MKIKEKKMKSKNNEKIYLNNNGRPVIDGVIGKVMTYKGSTKIVIPRGRNGVKNWFEVAFENFPKEAEKILKFSSKIKSYPDAVYFANQINNNCIFLERDKTQEEELSECSLDSIEISDDEILELVKLKSSAIRQRLKIEKGLKKVDKEIESIEKSYEDGMIQRLGKLKDYVSKRNIAKYADKDFIFSERCFLNYVHLFTDINVGKELSILFDGIDLKDGENIVTINGENYLVKTKGKVVLRIDRVDSSEWR